MASKLLHSLTDENQDLQKQIGCMNGIFQIFDRHQMGRRLNGNNRKGLLPPGISQFSNASLDPDSNNAYNQDAMERIGNKDTDDKRVPTKLSRASLSSSFAPSLSSLDCGKVGHPYPSYLGRFIIPETPSREQANPQPIASPKVRRVSLALRDVIMDSMHRESRGLSSKTMMKEECLGQVSKKKDSPCSLQPSKSCNGSLGIGMNGKNDLPGDLKESLKLLTKLRETPWYYSKLEHARLSYEIKDGSLLSTSRDSPRHSYNGREMSNFSSESQDFTNSNQRTKDIPRLSLDIREGSIRASSYDLNIAYLSKNAQKGDVRFTEKTVYAQKPSRPPSIVAKLMGLETSPHNKLSRDRQLGPTKVASLEDHGYSMHSKTSDICKPIRLPSSPRSSRKEPTSPHWKHADMRPISSSKCPVEPAPWKYLEGGRSFEKQVLKQLDSPERVSNSSPSVYRVVEKRLKYLELEQSGKDLRALKQILEAMEAQGLLGPEKEEHNSISPTKREDEQAYKGSNRSYGFASASEPHRKQAGVSMVKRAGSTNACESSIVTIKPAKHNQHSGVPASSHIPIDGPSCLQSQENNIAGRGKYSLNRQAAKNQTSKESCRDHAVRTSTNRVSSSRTLRVGQSSTKAQQVSRDNNIRSFKNSVSTSPTLQKKLEFDKRSHPPTPDSGRSRRQSNQHLTESGGSPGRRRRVNPSIMLQNDEHLTERSSECRNLSRLVDDMSVVTLKTKIDVEATRNERSVETSKCQILPNKAFKCSDITTKSCTGSTDGDIAEENLTIGPEHPSLISVLDALAYEEDSPSPVKQTSYNLEGIGPKTVERVSVEGERESVDNLSANRDVGSAFTSEINCNKAQNIDNLVEKLRQLKSDPNEIDTENIASLRQNSNPDHGYVLEIFLASGLLLSNLSPTFSTLQLHQSGQLINPELFLVLEQTNSSRLLRESDFNYNGEATKLKLLREKLHRKLIFDVVNEILVGKLASLKPPAQPWLKSCNLTKKTLNAEELLRDVCAEIEKLQVSERRESSTGEEDDGLKSIILWEGGGMDRMGTRTDDFHGDVSGVILDVERQIFRDLVDEVVVGEVSRLHGKLRKQCWRLFLN